MQTRAPSPPSGGVDGMRIALFTDSYLPTVDGVVTSVLSTRRQLEAHGHEVVVFAPEDPRRRDKSLLWYGANHVSGGNQDLYWQIIEHFPNP